MSVVDIAQTEKYKKMLGLTNFFTSSDNNTILKANVTILGTLYVSGYSELVGNTTIMSNLFVLENAVLNSNTFGKNINADSIMVNNNMTVLGNISLANLTIEGGVIIDKDSVVNNLNINNAVVTNISYLLNNLYVSNIVSPNELSINADNITIGDLKSEVILRGNKTYFATNEVNIYDKYIVLNNNPQDIGNYAGIEIKSTGSSGFIRTNFDSTRFELKAPLDDITRYIATVDINNNLNISGKTVLYGNSTILSTLAINGNTMIYGNSAFKSSLTTNGDTIFENFITANSDINIAGNTNIKGNVTILSSFNIFGSANLFKTTINSDLNINGNTVILGSLTIYSNLNVFGNTVLKGKTTINSNLYISDKLIINGNSTILSGLCVNGHTDILGNITINGNLLVSNNSIFYGNTMIKSNLNINSNTFINGNITLGSGSLTTNNFEILGQIINILPEYLNNEEASTNIPLWGFYRTGGILKIRLDNIAPNLILLGNTTIILNKTNIFLEPGITATDTVDTHIDAYLISITKLHSDLPNYIITPYLINSNNTINIIEISNLEPDNYKILYSGTDDAGNIGYVTRYLSILDT